MSFSGMSDNLCRLSAGIRIGFSLSDPSVSGGADTCDRINLDRLFMDGTLWIISDRDDRKNSGDDCFACNVFDRGYYVFIDCVLLGFARRCNSKNDVRGVGGTSEWLAGKTGRNDMDASGNGSEFTLDRYDICGCMVFHFVDNRKNMV